MSWNTSLYAFACDCMAKSETHWESGELEPSWGYTISARLAYLCDAVLNLVLIPFAALRVLFTGVKALLEWNWHAPHFTAARASLLEKTNHFFLSLLGSLISPALAYKYRDANLTPYIVAARITLMSLAMLYFYLKK